MSKKTITSYLIFLIFSFGFIFAHNNHSGKMNKFPDIPSYFTLKCDFHQHTVFSDGSVWPNIRVQEAIKDGVDAIAITDHLEYQPHKEDIPHPDRNRSYEIALKEAEGKNLIVIRGGEITRDMPPGHTNAIFLKDVNPLLKDDVMEVFREAKNQGAFTFWNHPNWTSQKPNGIAELTPMHIELISKGLLNGIEVVNYHTYSEEALQIALDHNLTMLSTSDIHGLIDWQYKVPEGGQRPLTLVFAKEKSEMGIKEGLENQRTVVLFNNMLIGKPEYLLPLIHASISLKETSILSRDKQNPVIHSLNIENVSSVDFILKNLSDYSFHSNTRTVTLKANETTVLDVKTVESLDEFDLRFEVINAFVAPKTNPEIILKVKNSADK